MKKSSFYVLLIIFISVFLAGCENDLNSVRAIELRQQGEVEFTREAEIIYSDSARVKAKLKTPELYNHKTKDPYYEMPKGIEIIFFDEFQNQTSKVTSEYAIRKENQKIVELRKNVVATNAEGKTFKSEELIWDENLKRFYSNKFVTIQAPNQDAFYGPGFWANEDFSYYEITQGTGIITLKEDLIGQ